MIAKRIAQFLVLVNTILVIPATAAALVALFMGSWDLEVLPVKIVIFLLWSFGISLFVFYIRIARAKPVKFPRIWWSLSALANGIPSIILSSDLNKVLLTQIASEQFITISIYFVTTILSVIALLTKRRNLKFNQTIT